MGFRFRIVVFVLSLTIAAAGMIAAAVFLGVALYSWLAMFFSPAIAALLCAGAAVLFALIVLLFGSLLARRRKKDDAAVLLGALLGEEVRGLTEASTAKRLLIALAAGFAVGLSPRLRKIIAGML